MIACSRCGTLAAPSTDTEHTDTEHTEHTDTVPAGWSFETGSRGVQWLCLGCTRDNVRSIEAKLPEEWW